MSEKTGRPKEYTDDRIEEIILLMVSYVQETDIPILAEFAYLNDIRRASLYEHPGLSYAREKLFDKKEAQLERKALNGEINPTMAIFSLKQMGWSDKQDLNMKATVDDITSLPPEERDKRIKELLNKRNG